MRTNGAFDHVHFGVAGILTGVYVLFEVASLTVPAGGSPHPLDWILLAPAAAAILLSVRCSIRTIGRERLGGAVFLVGDLLAPDRGTPRSRTPSDDRRANPPSTPP